MKTDNITVNAQSSIKIIFDKTIYFDPFKIEEEAFDADIIFITHAHYDHFDINSINKIINDNTVFVLPASMENDLSDISNKKIFLNPEDEIDLFNMHIKGIRAYNNNKKFHPRDNIWLGYLVEHNDITYYIAGDTDKTIDNEKVKCDIALIPIGGTYTMDVGEAEELVRIINPKVVIPTHYGSIVGSTNDGKELKEKLSNTNIEVVEKLY